jgi:ribosomal protein S27AE
MSDKPAPYWFDSDGLYHSGDFDDPGLPGPPDGWPNAQEPATADVAPVAATQPPEVAIRSIPAPAPVLKAHSVPARREPCDRCGREAYAPNRRDGRLLCSQCTAVVWRVGDEPPVDDATGLRLLARSLRNRLWNDKP